MDEAESGFLITTVVDEFCRHSHQHHRTKAKAKGVSINTHDGNTGQDEIWPGPRCNS